MAKTASSESMVGSKVPKFTAPATGGAEFGPGVVAGKSWVLYFYPKDATPGCTLEGRDFAKLHPKFKKAGAEVVGISRDTVKSHEKFKEKMGFPFTLVSDEDETICKLFDVIKMKNMYGRKVRGIERSTFVVDGRGVIRGEWRGVRVPGHAEEVLEFVKSLK